MGRLIDADDLINKINAYCTGSQDVDFIRKMVEEADTAYDVDAVVEQLEGIANMHRDLQASTKLSSEDRFRHTLLNGLSMTMIDIVRKGGKE